MVLKSVVDIWFSSCVCLLLVKVCLVVWFLISLMLKKYFLLWMLLMMGRLYSFFRVVCSVGEFCLM